MISPAWPKAKRFRMGSTTADRIGPWSTYESPMIRRNLRWKASGGPRGYPGNWTGKKLFGGAAITHLRRCWGSNGNRLRAWKLNLQLMADRIQIPATVCHYPPGTSNWNKIEHRLFSFISLNWKAEAATVRSPRVDVYFRGKAPPGAAASQLGRAGRPPTAPRRAWPVWRTRPRGSACIPSCRSASDPTGSEMERPRNRMVRPCGSMNLLPLTEINGIVLALVV